MGMYKDYDKLPNEPKYSAFVPHADPVAETGEVSRTRQEFADECDINMILARYQKTGVINHYAKREPRYLDLTNVPDFRESLDILRVADEAFMRLPANVRKEFDNDATKFVDFASDPKNVDKMREWGLAKPLEAPAAPMEVFVKGGALDPAEPLGDAPKPAKGKAKD